MAWYNDWLKNQIKSEINDLLKSDADQLPDKPEQKDDSSKDIGRKMIIDDPYFDNVNRNGIFKTKLSRITNKTLKDVSIRDWTVSAIIQCRVDTLLRFSRPSHKKLDMGFRFVKRDAKADYSPEDNKEIIALEDFIYNCGRVDGTPHDDRRLFGEFLKLIVRDALTFGYVCIEKVKTRSGGLHRFRPIPAENTYLIDKTLDRKFVENEMKNAMKLYQDKLNLQNNNPRADQEVNLQDLDYYKYIQTTYDNRTLAVFGDEDMIFKLFNPQNFADSQGYCFSPLELAIINITHHLNVENYNANFFTHGYAARGVLHLKGTVTQSQLAAFRRQFYNTISGSQHAWRTPVVAGLDEVNWVPMSGSAKEMEYINFNNHLLRAICAQFQIDPVEIGLDYLASANGRSPAQQANNEYKINYSRERGLYPILMFIEDLINSDILPAIDKNLANKYKFVFTGYTDESPQTDIAQAQAEMTVHSTMNDLLCRAEKQKLDAEVADLPLNAAFWALVEKNYTRGEIREKFFGDKGASTRKELQYIPGDPMFMGWQQLLLTIDRTKKQDQMMAEQAQAAQQQQDLENAHAHGKHQREEEAHARENEKHKAEMEALKNQAAHAAVTQGNLGKIAKQFGAASKPLNIGGTPVANPLNKK
jgi:hypothetical protein